MFSDLFLYRLLFALFLVAAYFFIWEKSIVIKISNPCALFRSRWESKVILQKLLGFLLFGLFPFLIFKSTIVVSFGSFIWVFIPVIFIGPFMFFNTKNDFNLKFYPQIRKKEWSIITWLVTFVGWSLYLLGYEFLFRQILFIDFLGKVNIYLLISVNVTVYALAHLPKGWKEVVGAIPFGLYVCVMTFYTKSFFDAFVLHLLLAMIGEGCSFYHHPWMVLKLKKTTF